MFSAREFILVLLFVYRGASLSTERTESKYYDNHVGTSQKCPVEHLFSKLEVEIKEQFGRLITEVQEMNRRIQSLEYQGDDIRTAVDGVRSELGRFVGSHERSRVSQRSVDTDRVQSNMASLLNGMQLSIATMRKLNSDVEIIKSNMSAIRNATGALLLRQDNLVSKHYLSTTLAETNRNYLIPNFPTALGSKKFNSTASISRSCNDILSKDSSSTSGIYSIHPENSPESFMVFCDMTTKGGGWTYIHNRFDGSQDFYQNLQSYKTGFGNLAGEFWLGLEQIYHLTGHEVNELLVELIDHDNLRTYAYYGAFSIGSYSQGYPLKVLGGYIGDAGDSLSYHAGSKFSTRDVDLDNWNEGSCAQSHSGAWWYKQCDKSNLNGIYINSVPSGDQVYQGMYWNDFRGPQYSLREARMMIRERSPNSPPVMPTGLGH